VIEQVLLTKNTVSCVRSPTIAQWAEGIAYTSVRAGSLQFLSRGSAFGLSRSSQTQKKKQS